MLINRLRISTTGNLLILIAFCTFICLSCGGGGSETTPPIEPPPPTTGSQGTTCTEDIAVLGDMVYLADGPGGLKIIDASDKNNPALVKEIQTTYAIRLYIHENRLYLCDGPAGIKVYSLADPDNPQMTFSDDTHWATSAAFRNGYLYVGDYFGGFRIYSNLNPSQPHFIDTIPVSRVRDMFFLGDILLVSDAPFGLAPYVMDSPTLPVNTYTDGSRMANFEDVVGLNGYAIIARNDEASNISVHNVQDVWHPAFVAETYVKRFIDTITINGNILLAACGEDGVVAYDLSNLPTLEKVFEKDTPGYARRAKIIGDYLYVADMDNLWIYDNPLLGNQATSAALNPPGFQRAQQASEPRPEFFNLRLLIGDIHCHTNFSDGDESPDYAIRYARDVTRLDFTCLTDHDNHFHNDDWVAVPYYRQMQSKYDDPGTFSVLFGFEWTSLPEGHRTVISYDNNIPILPFTLPEYDEIEELWAALAGYEAIAIPHTPMMHTPDWINHENPGIECAIEFHQKHGTYVETVLYLLSYEGRSYGVVANSDTHMSRPGSYLKESRQDDWFWDPRPGLTAVWVQENTRQAIYQAIIDGHCYGIQGTPIELQFSVNDRIMGSEIQASEPPEISVKVISDSVNIATVDIIRLDETGVQILQTYNPDSLEFEITYTDIGFTKDFAYTIIVTLENEDISLSTPVWVEKL